MTIIYHTIELVFPVYESSICSLLLKTDVTYGNRTSCGLMDSAFDLSTLGYNIINLRIYDHQM